MQHVTCYDAFCSFIYLASQYSYKCNYSLLQPGLDAQGSYTNSHRKIVRKWTVEGT